MSGKERLAYLAFAALERLGLALPESLGRPLFDAGGRVAYVLAPSARRVVSENLAPVLGRDAGSPLVRAATREAFRSYARYWFDTFHVRTMDDEEFLRRQTFAGADRLEEALGRGRGAIVALPHLGNWDTAGKWVAMQGWRITAVAELLRPEQLYQLFLDHRRALGMNVLPLGDDRKVAEECMRLMGENHTLALVSDRDLKGNGVVVEMFGRERRMPAGPAMLALATGAPLLPCACFDTADGWIAQIEAPIEIDRTDSFRDDVTTLTRLLARRFERGIAAAPTQWHMFQPAWEERAHAPAAAASP